MKFYITTPIYYVNDKPHIGHAYTTVLADVLARYHRAMGEEVFFLTGTDEHGQKVQQAAQQRGLDPQAHCDEAFRRFVDLWSKLGISHDKFIRTTAPSHKAYVQARLSALHAQGDLYAAEYEGWYCVGCERFWTEKDVAGEVCPDCQRPVQRLVEKNWFFRMARHQEWLIQTLEANPRLVFPESRRNEVLGFLRQPLEDLCISRPKIRLSWGIELPFDRDYVTYVWFDALLNYLSAVEERPGTWPAALHLIGKDILMPHAIYWPIMLKAMGQGLFGTLLVHGWWLMNGRKMSKSLGNVADPQALMERCGPDAFRYYLMREMVLGQDSDFTDGGFLLRVNGDLANDLGNMLSRVVKFALKNLPSPLSGPAEPSGSEARRLRAQAQALPEQVFAWVRELRISQALEEIMELVRALNRYFESQSPWKAMKQDPPAAREAVLVAAETLRIALVLLESVMPGKSAEGIARLGAKHASGLEWGGASGGRGELAFEFSEGPALFPRLGDAPAVAAPPHAATVKPPAPPVAALTPLILRARIEAARLHPQADKLLHLDVHDGARVRSVCAGIRAFYKPEELAGRLIALVANLKPAKLRGLLSEGMLLAAEGAGGALELVDPGPGTPGEAFAAEGQPAPAGEITLEDFQRRALALGGGAVLMDGQLLVSPNGGKLRCGQPDGSKVR